MSVAARAHTLHHAETLQHTATHIAYLVRPRYRQRDQPWDNDKLLDWQLVQRKMLDKAPWCNYTRKFSCADWRYAGTLTLFKKGLRKPERFYYNLDLEDGRHDDNGRVCIAQYSSGLRLANFYAPNNGWNEKSNFASRRDWDRRLLDFVSRCYQEQRPLIIIGDLNVAHADADVTHVEWFREQTGERTGKSWTQTGDKVASSDKGQPGFTQNEQTRFSEVLEKGHLIDTWRGLHPVDTAFEIGDPAWSWRGSEHQTDKYHARGMRIDYCLVSHSMCDRVQESTIIGKGVARKEGFCGSDHSPIFLKLLPDGADSSAPLPPHPTATATPAVTKSAAVAVSPLSLPHSSAGEDEKGAGASCGGGCAKDGTGVSSKDAGKGTGVTGGNVAVVDLTEDADDVGGEDGEGNKEGGGRGGGGGGR